MSRQNVAGALGSLLKEFETVAHQNLDKIPPHLKMLRPMLENAVGSGVFHDADGSMAERFWLYLEREILREKNGHGSS